MSDYHERCLRCKWLAPELTPPCGRLFEATVHISPYGGIVKISTTPGLIPSQFKQSLEEMLAKVFDRVIHVVEAWPGWADLAAMQRANQEKTDCPGRDEFENPYLRIVQ